MAHAMLCRLVRLQAVCKPSQQMRQLLTRVGAVAMSSMPRDWPKSTLGVLRIVIIILAVFLIWQFSDGFLLAWETLAEPTESRWFDVLSALCEGVLGPVLALSAIALSVANQRLPLAAILAILAAVTYVAPLAAFFIGIMIYGF
jgi:hypothetical protein